MVGEKYQGINKNVYSFNCICMRVLAVSLAFSLYPASSHAFSSLLSWIVGACDSIPIDKK